MLASSRILPICKSPDVSLAPDRPVRTAMHGCAAFARLAQRRNLG
jgi:hypothetical protein